ncbi:hypothetical protein P3T36_002872 [Kitasatospora sp. MAP12-15]|uniref:hypothetical protein n=1 Tax=unclassified Kitasatospora TaxID=2633591 RepID=UPI00247653C2|nr:hypothetical protein [Kitasatospora sp. MAP12-44]MDH6114051.1 hypothetical protein [Kitasatospora sp. MAP12-44]
MTDESSTYCAAPVSVRDVPKVPDAVAALTPGAEGAGPRADCVLCGEPTEFAAEQPGSTLCPVCAWQQAQRGACSG